MPIGAALAPMLDAPQGHALRPLVDTLRSRAANVGELPSPSERELLLERLRQRGQSEDVTTRFRI
jgi:hypothetical protein